jgi:hypothetical protein
LRTIGQLRERICLHRSSGLARLRRLFLHHPIQQLIRLPAAIGISLVQIIVLRKYLTQLLN